MDTIDNLFETLGNSKAEHFLVFYSVDAEFLSIDRILHAKRDYNRQRL